MGTKQEGDSCFAAAMPDEPMFVMLARDESAPALVRQWGAIRAMEIRIGRRPESDWAKIDEAYALADRMVAWREAADESWRKQGNLFDVGQGLEAHEAFADVAANLDSAANTILVIDCTFEDMDEGEALQFLGKNANNGVRFINCKFKAATGLRIEGGYHKGAPACQGYTQRQGDEIACSCGKRWGVDEIAPDGHL